MAAAGIEICSSPGESSDLGRTSSNEIFRFLLGTFSVVVLTKRMIVDVVGLDFFVDFEQCRHYRLLFCDVITKQLFSRFRKRGFCKRNF